MTTLRKWMSFALTPLWRWKWLLLLLLGVTIGYALFSRGHEYHYQPWPNPGASWVVPPPPPHTEWGHGWPWKYEEREIPKPQIPQRWAIWSDVARFYWVRLVANLAIAVGLSLAFTYLIAWRLSGSNRWRFGLRDLLAATMMLGVVFGVARHYESAYQADQVYITEIAEQGWRIETQFVPIEHLRPLHDLGLLSDGAAHAVYVRHSRQYPSFERAETARMALIRDANQGRRLYHSQLALSTGDIRVDDETIAALAKWAPNCQHLHLGYDGILSDRGVETLVAAWPNLQTLKIGSSFLTAKSLNALSQLSQLRRLDLHNASDAITADDLMQLQSAPQLKMFAYSDRVAEQPTPQQQESWDRRGIVLRSGRFFFISEEDWMYR
ncbi:hypothetical protein LOC68_12890 [Blastopirellula sp. JC732]|uniref:Leucine-rich repeat domain-containing protein n=1 Tax=Blastopirellula sediminis TaxID=2894196 RepID=A0A9X1SGE7_9BACT|nr:hypothetical protein [Blastopirellula sediminis]MCC9607414.1 hypothetical protein [Blastopirellula sediminis]MCC9629293.1 hypothetical protein [Blastopirellula sediminis]